MAGSNEPFGGLGKFLEQLLGSLEGSPEVQRIRESMQRPSTPEPSSAEQRENLAFALATRAVEALEDIALNAAAIRQRLERRDEDVKGSPEA